jgi:adenylosuccinate synthase
MPVTAVVGANWGDEGKGKVTDFLAARADFVVRFQGGRNAGHTVINSYGKFALHMLPSGVFRPEVVNMLGPGVALDIRALVSELESLRSRGVPEPEIRVSERAQVVLPCHILIDRLEESRLGDAKFGSTQCGIAPFYGDKYLKLGVQVADLFQEKRLRERIERNLAAKNVLFEHFYQRAALSVDELITELLELRGQIEPFVCDTTTLLHRALEEDKYILLEGQLGALRDPDHGIYPFSTSSSPLAGFASVGAGIPPSLITRVVAVTKAYSTCVGAAPFVTELSGEAANALREHGADAGEYGATTGRPRRVGWFDAVATRYGCRLQGATEVALTVLDCLGYLDEIQVCTAYEIDGELTTVFPVSAKLERVRPVYEALPGWKCDISAVRSFGQLPSEARRYVSFLESLIGVPITWISVGPHRDATIHCESRSPERGTRLHPRASGVSLVPGEL